MGGGEVGDARQGESGSMTWAHELSPLWLGDLKSKNYATSDLIPCPHNFHLSVSGRREEEEEGGDAKQGESGSPGPFLLPAARTWYLLPHNCQREREQRK